MASKENASAQNNALFVNSMIDQSYGNQNMQNGAGFEPLSSLP